VLQSTKQHISLIYQIEKMEKMQNFIKALFLLVSIMAASNKAKTQGLPPSDTLYRQIAKMDSVLFTAFNNRDMETFKKIFAEDLEFYHDKGGLTDYAYTVQSFKNTIARNDGLKRTLVKGSLEVYPIKDYGAIQIGAHTFCHLENGKDDCGTFKFVHIWKRIGDEWKIVRVVSYDH
jgi:hypothetical protein